MIWALIRPRKKDLTISRSITSTEGDLLLASGRFQSRHHQLVHAGHRLGRVEGDAPLHRERSWRASRNGATCRWSALSRRRHGHAVHALALDARIRRRGARGDELKTMACPFTGETAGAAARAQPGLGADPRAALRRLRQCPARRVAVHGHRHRDGRQPRDPDHGAHHLQRADPPHARPDAHSVFHRGGGGGGADGLRAARVLRRLRAVLYRTSTTMPNAHRRMPWPAAGSTSRSTTTRRSRGRTICAKIGMEEVLDACRRGRSVYND